MKEFEIGEASDLLKLKKHTLRYYENIGLITNIRKNSSGKRIYTENDLKSLEFINRLRKTGMSIKQMRKYSELRRLGDSTITERKNIMKNHLDIIKGKINELLEAQDYVSKKVEAYTEMEENINGR